MRRPAPRSLASGRHCDMLRSIRLIQDRADRLLVFALAGEIGPRPGAEGETAPETLKQKDRASF